MLESWTMNLVRDLLRLDPGTRLGQAVSFFIYDSVKILLLLFGMIAVIGVLRSYLPQERIRNWLSRQGMSANFFAAVFGAVTPFCSCSSIPLFISFIKSGVPLGVAFSFLITSPVINEYLVVLMIGFFGWKITLSYVISGLLIGTVSGVILGRMRLEANIVEDIAPTTGDKCALARYSGFVSRLVFGVNESWCIVSKLWIWVLAGVGLGAIIHNYIPNEAVQAVTGRLGFFSVPVATMIGAPMYGSCAAIVPIAVVLFQKGIPLGTALSFMMAVAALSLPEAVMLRRVMNLRLVSIFFGIVTVAIIITGYVFNFLQLLLR